jgi:hypothetical protein
MAEEKDTIIYIRVFEIIIAEWSSPGYYFLLPDFRGG